MSVMQAGLEWLQKDLEKFREKKYLYSSVEKGEKNVVRKKAY